MPLLSLRSVSKSFGALKVTDDVSFDVQPGEALGIIGPNGAGKSTLFNLISGNLLPDTGKVFFDGQDITQFSPMRRSVLGIGRSFQIPQPFGRLSVYENLLVAAQFGGGLRGHQAADHCMSILDQTGLSDVLSKPAGGLPLLKRKRLELARAMATSPRLILLDEIAGGLTEGECDELVHTINNIHTSGTAIIWIEHVLHALNSVVQRLMVLNFGSVVMLGQPDTVMTSNEVREIYLGIEA